MDFFFFFLEYKCMFQLSSDDQINSQVKEERGEKRRGKGRDGKMGFQFSHLQKTNQKQIIIITMT